MNINFRRGILPTSVAVCFFLEAGPALAQMDVIEEIVVSARKRDESILKVPVTATVMGADALEQYAIDDVGSLADKVPGLNIGSNVLSAGVQASMRGIGTSTFNATVDQSVALVADGIQMTHGVAFKAATFDMAQIEVLKGPQALFFGKAAPAGVIAVKTADPSEEFDLILRGGYEAEAQAQLGELIISGPVTDTLGLRLAAQYSEGDGYFRNDAQPADHPIFGSLGASPTMFGDFPTEESLLLRGTAVWEPTDRFDMRLKVSYNDVDSQGSGDMQLASCPEGTASYFGSVAGLLTASPSIEFIGGEDCRLDDKFRVANMDSNVYPGILNDGISFFAYEQLLTSLELSHDLSDSLTFSSVTGSYDLDQEALVNGSSTSQYGPAIAIQGIMDRNDITEELRLTSNFEGPMNFMMGAFYHKGEADYWSSLPFNQTYAALMGGVAPLVASQGDLRMDIEAQSVFGQGLWQATPDLEVGLGARWTDEERSQVVYDEAPFVHGFTTAPVEVSLAKPEIRSTNWSPEISLTYTPTDDLTWYGNLKRAYKSGSFVASGTPSDGDDTSFDDERVTGGELGVKSRGLDGSLAFNAATYYYKYKDMQVQANIFDPASGVARVTTVNAASSEIYGVEFDVSYAPPSLEGLSLFAAANWNKAEYVDFDNGLCWSGQLLQQGCDIDVDSDGVGDAQDLSGEPLVRAPEWMANFGLDYERTVFDGLALRLGSNTSYSSSYSAGIENRGDMYQDSYTKTSASVALAGPNAKWVIALIGDNLTDEIVTGNCSQGGYADAFLFTNAGIANVGTGTSVAGPSGAAEILCAPERGRSLWLRLTFSPSALFNR